MSNKKKLIKEKLSKLIKRKLTLATVPGGDMEFNRVQMSIIVIIGSGVVENELPVDITSTCLLMDLSYSFIKVSTNSDLSIVPPPNLALHVFVNAVQLIISF
jgi:hypothetical protein